MKLASDAVAYAADHDVRLALENGQLSFLVDAIENVEGLGICLDVGHVYFTPNPMSEFLEILKDRIIHLHIQDILPKTEDSLPRTARDHYTPGTGGVPAADWELLAETLKEVDFQGTAVFEILPRNPLQTALWGVNFMQKLLDD